MAKQNIDMTGGFSGRLGQLVGYQWNGRWCLRMRPQRVRNPRTEAQQSCRARFSGAVQLAARMRQGVMEGLQGTAREAGMTAYNAFVSLNQHAFGMAEGVFTADYSALRLSTGPVAPVAVEAASVGEGNVLTVSFEKNPMHMRANGFDMVHLYVYSPDVGVGYLAAAVYRRQGRVAVSLPDVLAGHELHVYLFTSDGAGRHSETAYGGTIWLVDGAAGVMPWDDDDNDVDSGQAGRRVAVTMEGERKRIEVVAAIIHDAEGRIFATQRGYGDWKGWWEFPGGKMEAGESEEDALRREIWEELETRIAVERRVTTVEYDYPAFHLTMHCYLCRVESGELTLKEHEAARWLAVGELESVSWLPADKGVVALLQGE